jgi:ribosome biogenesis GTPase
MVVLLNKADLNVDVAGNTETIRALAGNVPVLTVSAATGFGVETLQPYLQYGRTVALLGSSGAGKSTLVNRLLGSSRQAVGILRHDDDRGRHTTTRRELIVLPAGALLIDTPGLRELQLWDHARDGLVAVFPEIVELATQCRFRDCRHEAEPDCAVQAAICARRLDAGRFASFRKLRAELEARGNAESKSGRRPTTTRVTGRRIMRG